MSDIHASSLHRLLRLRQFPMLAAIDLDELATIAENLVETRIPAGTQLAVAGYQLDAVHFITEGRLESRPHGRTWESRELFGALEVLSGREIATTVVSATDVVTLSLPAEEVGEVLEDNFGALLGTLRALAARLVSVAQPSQRAQLVHGAGTLGLVERLILLRQQLPFATARLQALATLAHASDEVDWPAHTEIVHIGDPATHAFVIVEGAVLARTGDATRVLEAGSSIGHLETLAGTHHTSTFETMTPVRTLRSGVPAILDVIEDHTDVGLAMIATFASALLDAAVHVN